ncbi:MAG: hypothetical protein J1E78_07085 [Muribaculaceae bacterium]|nr:hypothetical protein [Muribaculaceae bacterium]
MTKKFFVAIILFVAAFLGTPRILAQIQMGRLEPISVVTPSAKIIMSQGDCEVRMTSQTIEIVVSAVLRVDIFTLLGKPVVSQILDPGAYSFKPDKHGLYIIKTPEGSCKVSL